MVNGEANVARAGPIGNSKPNSPSFAGKNEIKSEGENKEEPAELDLMARVAGLRPVDRWEDWRRRPFTSDSTQHVSVWRKV